MNTRTLCLGLVAIAILTLASSCPSITPPANPTNQAPIASFSCSDTSGQSPLLVILDASTSNDPDGWITQYQWDFGDSETGDGVASSHIYTATTSRTYAVRLTVADNEGETASTTRSISVSVEAPPPLPSNSYVASRESDVFHRLSCRYADQIHLENEIYFGTRVEAIASGRRPCKVCSP